MDESTRIVEGWLENIGASVDGPKHVRPDRRWCLGRGAVDGLVGKNPPYHHAVFILTHHPRDPVEMKEA